MENRNTRTALDRHWAASEAGDNNAEDEIYHDDAVLEYPQSGERIRGRLAIRTTRGLLPNKQFTIRRVLAEAISVRSRLPRLGDARALQALPHDHSAEFRVRRRKLFSRDRRGGLQANLRRR